MINLYVAKNGSNTNDGSLAHPFADIYTAKRVARTYIQNGEDVTVFIREGEYELTEPLLFNKADSANGRYLTFKAYEGEHAAMLGGIKIGKERFTPASEEEKARLLDRKAADNLMRIDLSDKKDKLFKIRNSLDSTYAPTALFVEDHAMWHARYPKRDFDGAVYTYGPYVNSCGYEYTTEAKNKSVNVFFNSDVMSRVKLWGERSLSDLWLAGFPKHEWSDETHRIVSVDHERGTVLTDDYPYRYAPIVEANSSKRYFFFNVFEELSSPYEYYIDYERGYVYTCVRDGIIPEDMHLGTLDDPMLSFNLCRNISFEGIEFAYTHGSIASILSSHNIVFENCKLAHGSDNGIRMVRSSNIKIQSSDIYDFQCGGISIIECGDRSTLSSAGIIIDNCVIHDVDQLYQCYNPCISNGCGTCGVTITHNKIYNSTHNLIGMSIANNVEVAYNEIFNGCTDTGDSSVIYWGRNPSTLGHKIHDNYFHDCVCEWSRYGTAVIYQDDTGTGAEIYNNIFYKCGSHDTEHAGIIKGHVFHHTFNNIFIELDDKLECTTPFGYNMWKRTCMGAETLDNKNTWYNILAEAGFFSSKWRSYYQGTFWQMLYDLLPLDLLATVDAYRETIKDDPIDLQNAKLQYVATDLAWSRKFWDGTPCEEDSVYECMEKHFPEDFAKAMAEVEGKGEVARYKRLTLLVDEMYWFKKFRPDYSVFHDGNLTIALSEKFLDENGMPDIVDATHENNFNMPTDKMPNGESIFVEYGKNFALTPAGLAYVQSKINGFSPIDTSVIGAKR